MSYPRSPPHSPDDWKSRGMMSKTFSTSSRSTNPNSRSASMASSSNRPYNNINYEHSARTYYVELRKYLASFLAKEAAEGVHPQRASARQKLSRLSNLQFHELAMDVYDELMRRNLNDKFVPFLAVREEFHPKRNQARQKLATLPEPRFKDLASDVYYELTRRYPHIMDADDSSRPPMPPMPSTSSPTPKQSNHQMTPPPAPPASQSTTIVPMKGTINVEPISSKDSSDEEEDDVDTQFSENSPIGKYAPQHNGNYQRKQSLTPQSTLSSSPSYHYQQQQQQHLHHNPNGSSLTLNGKQEGESLDSLMADLGNMVHSRSQESDSNPNYQRSMGDMDKKRQDDYESHISSLTKRIQLLEIENQDLLTRKGSRDDTENDREQRLKSRLQQLQDEYNRLDEQFRTLERDHNDQQQIVQSVKQETSLLMEELEKLSKENDKLQKEKEQSESTNRHLSQEIQVWQTKYQKLRLELRNTKGLPEYESDIPNHNIVKDHFLQPARTGVISYDSIISYQAAIEDLLKRARSKTPSDVLTSMKTIVMTCKSMTEDVERYEAKSSMALDKKTKLQALKGPFSNGLAHLVAAAKSHVNSMGISPVGLLDAAASNLTMAVVDLVKLVGMVSSTSPSSSSSPLPSSSSSSSAMKSMDRNADLHTYHNAPTPSASKSRDLRRQDSSSSSISAKKSISSNKTVEALLPSQLVEFLKKETDSIVSSVQSLLSTLRSSQKIGDVYGIITSIADVVTTVMDTSSSTFNGGAGLRHQQQGDVILSDLRVCRDKLLQIRNASFARSPELASATVKRDLAKESYEIAKFIKELISLCEN